MTIGFLFIPYANADLIGKKAPTFSLSGAPDKVELSKLKGKPIVLEWFNEGCPFVRKHYDSNNMQGLQAKYQDKVHWLTINSSAEGKQGYIENSEAAKSTYTKEQMKSLSLLMDSNGKIGRQYDAKTTPHMFIINEGGEVIYEGGIDSIASADQQDIKNATNYVATALDDHLAGRKIAQAKTRPYGCSVKY